MCAAISILWNNQVDHHLVKHNKKNNLEMFVAMRILWNNHVYNHLVDKMPIATKMKT